MKDIDNKILLMALIDILSRFRNSIHKLCKKIKNSEDQEIVCSKNEWWIDLEKTSKSSAERLLLLVLIRDVTEVDGDFHRYELNEDGECMASDDQYKNYIPSFITSLKEQIG